MKQKHQIRWYVYYLFLISVLFAGVFSNTGFSEQQTDTGKDCVPQRPEDLLMERWHKSPIEGTDGWELVLDKNDIKVYLRDVDISPIKSFKGVMEVDADLSSLVALIMDVERYPAFVDLCAQARVIKRVSETETYEDTINEAIWPVKPRNSVVYSRWVQAPETLTVTMKSISVPDYIPEKEGYIRTPLLITSCRLMPITERKIRVSYEAIVDIGGWVPAWIVNFYLVNTPFNTMKAIQDMMPLEQYKGCRFGFLKEPKQLSALTN